MTLTVIIASHNAAHTLRDQLDALTTQPWPAEGEVIVADNRSTDDTQRLVAAYQDAVVPVRHLRVDDAPGAAHTRNSAVPHASFDHLAFCDADDVVGPGWVMTISDALRHHDFVGGPLEYARLNEPWLASARGRELSLDEPAVFEDSFTIVSSCNMGIRSSAFAAVGGFDTGFERVEDAELSLRLAHRGIQPVHLPDAVVHYRMRTTGRAIFAQSRSWGRQLPLLRSRIADRPPRPSTRRVKSWLWLLVRAPGIADRSRRAHWLHVAGTRIGSVEGRVIHAGAIR